MSGLIGPLMLAKSGLLGVTPISAVPVAPTLVIFLCVIAGLGTVLLLPSRQEGGVRKIGGVLLAVAALIFAATITRWTMNSGADVSLWSTGYFWIFSAIALVGAIRVVTHSKPVYSALYFVLSIFASAGLFLLLWAEFMAIALILIYAGAILVTYVFVIMLASEATGKPGAIAGGGDHDMTSREPLLACITGFVLMGMMIFVIFDKFQAIPKASATASANMVAQATMAADKGELVTAPATPKVVGSTQELGEYLFTNQAVSLELAGLILTIAMVGAIMIARRNVIAGGTTVLADPEVVLGPSTPVDDNPHSIPVYGTMDPRQKSFPQT